MRLIEYANLKYLFKGEAKEKIINLLNSDEWSLFEQYREVIEKTKGQNKRQPNNPKSQSHEIA